MIKSELISKSGSTQRGSTISGYSRDRSGNNSCNYARSQHRHVGIPIASNVWFGRILFISCLGAVAATFGYFSNRFLAESETDLAEKQFESIADRALDSAREITLRKRLGTITMSSIVANANPNAEAWPYVTTPGYEVISSQLIKTSQGRGMGFCPLIMPNQIDSFNAFASEYFVSQRQAIMAEVDNTNVDGQDDNDSNYFVWRPMPDNGRMAEINGMTDWNGSHEILAPMIQHSKGIFNPKSPLLQNLYHEEIRGHVIDDIIECSQLRAAAVAANSSATKECGEITDMIFGSGEPGAFIMQPVYPANDPTVLTGIIVSGTRWAEALEGGFAEHVNGVDCVLETETHTYTFQVNHGVAEIRGIGDLHEECYHHYAKTISLTGEPGSSFSSNSASYKLTLYPNGDLFDVYGTRNPLAATFGSICLMLFTSLLFLLYDFFVRKEFNNKQSILKAKRMFVRYVSHEVRTPLNAACMGLRLIQEVGLSMNKIINDNKNNGSISNKDHVSVTLKEGEFPKDFKDEEAFGTSNGSSNNNTLEEKFNDVFDLSREVLCNTERAVDILNDLLNYDKIEMGTMQLETSIVPIWDVIEKSANEFKVPAMGKKISLIVDFSSLLNFRESNKGNDTVESIGDLEAGNFSQNLPKARDLPYSVQECRVMGDTIRITQVIRNLLSNALKFTKEGGQLIVTASWQVEDLNSDMNKSTLTVCTKKSKTKDFLNIHTFTLPDGEEITSERRGCLQLNVKDTGVGMSEDQLEELFGDGVQFNVNKLQAGQGSGLGLFIAKGIVEQHGGTLTATSEGIGYGTEFTLRLPLYKLVDEELPEHLKHLEVKNRSSSTMNPKVDTMISKAATTTTTTTTTTATLDLGSDTSEPLRILVVDDSKINRKLLMRLLQNRGHTCDEAEDGNVAVMKVTDSLKKKQFYDTILLDWVMPEKDGPTAAKEIRALGCDSFIVGITGNVLPNDVKYFKECGANYVFPKPIRVESLECIWIEFGVTGKCSSETDSVQIDDNILYKA